MELPILTEKSKKVQRKVDMLLSIGLASLLIAALLYRIENEIAVNVSNISFLLVIVFYAIATLIYLSIKKDRIIVNQNIERIVLNLDKVDYPKNLRNLKYSGNFVSVGKIEYEITSKSARLILKQGDVIVEAIEFKQTKSFYPFLEHIKSLGKLGPF